VAATRRRRHPLSSRYALGGRHAATEAPPFQAGTRSVAATRPRRGTVRHCRQDAAGFVDASTPRTQPPLVVVVPTRPRRGPAAAWARAPRVGAELGATSPSGCRERPLLGGLPVGPRLVAGSTTRKRLSGAFGQAPGGASTQPHRPWPNAENVDVPRAASGLPAPSVKKPGGRELAGANGPHGGTPSRAGPASVAASRPPRHPLSSGSSDEGMSSGCRQGISFACRLTRGHHVRAAEPAGPDVPGPAGWRTGVVR
jgi:hypothetical protein